MPLLHCKKCMHEWEGQKNSKCDWCGSSGVVLEEETPFEKFCREYFEKERYKKIIN